MSRVDKLRSTHGDDTIRTVVANSRCKVEVAKKLGVPANGAGARTLRELLETLNCDTSHFGRDKKHPAIKKNCPVCKNDFVTYEGIKGEKTTCSHGCSNTYYRSGDNNGRRRARKSELKYDEICWKFHERKCVVCSESLVVAAHHYNGNHDDNRPENFAPLCPTHHVYWHSGHRHLIKDIVDKYVSDFGVSPIGMAPALGTGG